MAQFVAAPTAKGAEHLGKSVGVSGAAADTAAAAAAALFPFFFHSIGSIRVRCMHFVVCFGAKQSPRYRHHHFALQLFYSEGNTLYRQKFQAHFE